MTTRTYDTIFGKVTLYRNEMYIGSKFMRGQYWDLENLKILKKYIPVNKNIIEIGGHCGTSTLVYASYLSRGSKIYVYEPQQKMYEILQRNISQNGLEDLVETHNMAVFSSCGEMKMSSKDLDGSVGALIESRLKDESYLPCNFGGLPLGQDGETVTSTTVDAMNHKNVGFIHCDAQGAESFIFYSAKKTIYDNLPVIYFEDNRKYNKHLFEHVAKSYPLDYFAAHFDVTKYCVEQHGYTAHERFNGGIDTLLIPPSLV